MYEGSTWHILGRLKIWGSEKVWKEMKFWTVSVNFGDFQCKLERRVEAHSWWAGYGTCAVIKDLSRYQQSNPVSSVAAPATCPKTEKYLGNSHIGLLIAVKYSYFFIFVSSQIACQQLLQQYAEIWFIMLSVCALISSPLSPFPFLGFYFILFYFYFLATSTSRDAQSWAADFAALQKVQLQLTCHTLSHCMKSSRIDTTFAPSP